MNAVERGRADLAAWEAAQPDDLYAVDGPFRELVRWHGLADREETLHRAGRLVAGPLDRAARLENLAANLPVVDDWDAVGRPTGAIRHHPAWRDAGRAAYGTGVMAAYGEDPVPHRLVLGLFYLTAQAGEAGHNCPLACAAGAIRALQRLGTPEQQDRYLPGLLDPDFDTNLTAAQFLTEVQGGSDVGANACSAEPVDPHATGPGSRWRIRGEKWFCSNADADVFLMTARVAVGPQASAPGTRGLGLFLVPRLRPDGTPNGFRIRRAKDKIGTRTLVTAEIDFQDAHAEALGPVERGFRHAMELVIDTSRLFNSAGAAAHARRAAVVAGSYARHRAAFGRRIAEYGPVQETLAWMEADAAGMIAATLWLAEVLERVEAGSAGPDEAGFFRLALNLTKTWTARLAHDAVNRGIEVLAGNGTVETFSVLPRLLRDNVVYENWEGAHNVLRAQALRDILRLGLHEPFFAVLAERLGPDWQGAVAAEQSRLQTVLTEADERLRDLLFRRVADRLATWVMVGGMARVPALADHVELVLRHLGEPRVDADYLARLARVAGLA